MKIPFCREISSLDDLKDIPKLRRPLQEYEAKQERIGQPTTVEGFLFEHMREAERE